MKYNPVCSSGWGTEQRGLWKMSLPVAGGWSEMTLKVASNPNHSMILKWKFSTSKLKRKNVGYSSN